MATRRPAKIASKKKGSQHVQLCPECQSEMQVSKIIRVDGPSGMFWLCSNNSCSTLVSTSGARAGALELR